MNGDSIGAWPTDPIACAGTPTTRTSTTGQAPTAAPAAATCAPGIGPCGATDGFGLVDGEPYGRCTLEAGHQTGGWHQEWRGTQLWAEWRGPAPGQRCGICGKDGSEH